MGTPHIDPVLAGAMAGRFRLSVDDWRVFNPELVRLPRPSTIKLKWASMIAKMNTPWLSLDVPRLVGRANERSE
jgi:hypothetical protein